MWVCCTLRKNLCQKKNSLVELEFDIYGSQSCVTYWLNRLQNLKSEENYFLTINPNLQISESKIIKKVNFAHPFFNTDTMNNQKELLSLQGTNRTWYCGAYFGYGFHEDGLNSAINMIKLFKA